jgi:hypothetical protein
MLLGRLLSVALLVAVSFGCGARAQEGAAPNEKSPDVQQRIERLSEFQPRSAGDLALPEAPDQRGLVEETSKAYQETLRAYYAYRQTGYEHRLRVFEWQSLSSKIIFVVVLVLVAAGIYFAAIQFHAGLRSSGQSKNGQPEVTELVMSLKELKVRSPVLGVIVLTISLAFFYLYLVYVYPIENVF